MKGQCHTIFLSSGVKAFLYSMEHDAGILLKTIHMEVALRVILGTMAGGLHA